MPDRPVPHLCAGPQGATGPSGPTGASGEGPFSKRYAAAWLQTPLQQTAGLDTAACAPYAGICSPIIPVSGYEQCCSTAAATAQCLQLTAPGSRSGSCASRVAFHPSSTALTPLHRQAWALYGVSRTLHRDVHRCAGGLALASASAPRPSMWAALASARCSTRTRARPPSMAAARPWPPISALAPTARACSFQPRPSSAKTLPGSAARSKTASALTRSHSRARLQAAPSASTT